MPKIIISYRRSSTQAVTGRIVDRLIAHFGDKSVFLDVDNIPFGIDFRDHIQSALSLADVLIAVVGPDWLGTPSDGGTRLEAEDDPVRVEIETALRQNLLIIPVLVDGAAMPAASVLPDSIRSFAFINAAPIDAGRDFRPHVDRLIKSIEDAVAQRPAGTSQRSAPTAQQRSEMRLSATAVFVVLVAGGFAWLTGLLPLARHPAPDPVALSPSTTVTPAPVTAVNAPVSGSDQATPTVLTSPTTATPVVTPTAPTRSPRPNATDEFEWGSVEKSSVQALQSFVDTHPYSPHLHEAEVLIAKLSGKATR